MAEIERDLALGVFDTSLARYRPQPSGGTAPVPEPEGVTLTELWAAYLEAKRPQLRESTVQTDYAYIQRRIAELPARWADEVSTITARLTKHHGPRAARKILRGLSAACAWGVKEGLIASNPLEGVAQAVRVPRRSAAESPPDPFSPEERRAVLTGFRSRGYSAGYVPLIEFLFFTGCRPCEAVALRWGDVRFENNSIYFCRNTVLAGGRQLSQDGLKTQRGREFPLNIQLRALLESIRPERVPPERLVFPAPRTGGAINWRNLTERHWYPALKQGGVRERAPYCTRDTFITECLERGISPVLIARWVGNSAEIILRRYAGVIERRGVPEF